MYVPFLSFSVRRIHRYEKPLAAIILFSARPKFSSIQKAVILMLSLLLSLPGWHQIHAKAKCWLCSSVLKGLGHDSFIPAAYSDPVWQL